MPRYYELSKTKLLGKWGDYGDILYNGLDIGRRGETPLRLGRTGPFVPPITFVWDGHVVVTAGRKWCQPPNMGKSADRR